MNRRQFLRNLAVATTASLLPACVTRPTATSTAASAPLRFAVVNDLHHGGPDCTQFLDTLIADIAAHRPAFSLAVGDIADRGAPESLIAVRDAFARHDLALYPVPGNHDCDIGDNTAVYSEVFPDRLNYSFAQAGWQFIGFDSTDGSAWQNTRIGADALSFLDTASRTLDPRAPTIAFTHFPLTDAVKMASLNADDALALLGRLNLRATFGGHFHGASEHAHGTATLLTHPCCSLLRGNHDGTLPEGYVLCTAHADGRLERAFIPFAPAFA